MAPRLIVLVVLASCGRVDFDPLGDASLAGDGNAGDGAAACTAFGPWGAPKRIAELATTASEYGGQMLGDGLTLYFDRHTTVPDELFVAQRPDRASPFGPAQALPALGTASSTGSATLSADGLELYFETGSPVCIHRATRATTASAWGAPVPVAALCGSPTEGAFLTSDGLTLYYNTATPPTDYEGTIMITTRASTTVGFGAGSPAGIVLTATNGYPALSSNELTIYFESGAPTDLWQATRPDRGSSWGAPSEIAGVNTASIEQDVSISPDGTELFFASDRMTSGDLDLYVATRACL